MTGLHIIVWHEQIKLCIIEESCKNIKMYCSNVLLFRENSWKWLIFEINWLHYLTTLYKILILSNIRRGIPGIIVQQAKIFMTLLHLN